MRIWITKHSDLPIREQLIRQVILGILSEDLPAGRKLPSTRALARRYKIHPNTASAAYHALCLQGWLELRRGSGIYVRRNLKLRESSDLDSWLQTVLAESRLRGFLPLDILQRLTSLIQPKRFAQLVVVEPDPAMREILAEELRAKSGLPVDALDPYVGTAIFAPAATLFVALPTRIQAVQSLLPRGATLLPLKLRSISTSLEAETMPPPGTLIAIASRSKEFRATAIELLTAVGIPSTCLCQIDPQVPGWRDRVREFAITVVDAVVAGELPAHPGARLFRIISDECLAHLREMAAPEPL